MNILKQTLYQLFFIKFRQTKDNNKSAKNKLENESLTNDFTKRYFQLEVSKLKSVEILINFHIKSQEILTGEHLTRNEANYRAIKTFEALKEVDLVDEDNSIIPELKKLYLKLDC